VLSRPIFRALLYCAGNVTWDENSWGDLRLQEPAIFVVVHFFRAIDLFIDSSPLQLKLAFRSRTVPVANAPESRLNARCFLGQSTM